MLHAEVAERAAESVGVRPNAMGTLADVVESRGVGRAVPMVGLAAIVLYACSADPRAAVTGATASSASPTTPVVETQDESEVAAATTETTSDVAEPAGSDAAIRIDVSAAGREIDARVFGVNVPAWLGPDVLADEQFVDRAAESGATLIRMPGGTWSNSYRWSACELGLEECFWPWAARPSDFVGFLRSTGLPGLWTVSINETAQSAAAVVAFFNGAVGDETVIGLDRDGVDWGTVGRWAEVRAAGGHPEPVGVQLWEVGNEVYGGQPASGGAECADFGWEDVWTCDGSDYVLGVDGHDGYLDIRSAMLAVDPSISVGAVGVSEPSSWSGWGDEVIEGSGDALDFYVVHTYGFDSSPSGEEAVARAVELWPQELRPIIDRLADVPLALTEYNLVSFESGDTERTMTQAMNALYLADSLGQLVVHDVPIAAVWTLASGTCWPDCDPGWAGTDYGLVRVDDLEPQPAFEAFRAWSRAGTHRYDAILDGDVRFYPTRDDDGRVAVIVVNTGETVTVRARLDGAGPGVAATLSGSTAAALDADGMTGFDAGEVAISGSGDVEFQLPARSVSVLEVES